VHDAEAGSGQGQEDSRVGGDRFVDALAPFETGTQEMAGITSVQRGARGTAQLATRPAGLEHNVVGKGMAGEDDAALGVEDMTTQADGMRTPPTARALSQEIIQTTSTRVPTDCIEHGHVPFVQHGGHDAQWS
jgi:hypothetical protein